jgi:hypothetical protein
MAFASAPVLTGLFLGFIISALAQDVAETECVAKGCKPYGDRVAHSHKKGVENGLSATAVARFRSGGECKCVEEGAERVCTPVRTYCVGTYEFSFTRAWKEDPQGVFTWAASYCLERPGFPPECVDWPAPGANPPTTKPPESHAGTFLVHFAGACPGHAIAQISQNSTACGPNGQCTTTPASNMEGGTVHVGCSGCDKSCSNQ